MLFYHSSYCRPRGRLSDPTHEFQGCYAQKCSRDGVGWVMVTETLESLPFSRHAALRLFLLFWLTFVCRIGRNRALYQAEHLPGKTAASHFGLGISTSGRCFWQAEMGHFFIFSKIYVQQKLHFQTCALYIIITKYVSWDFIMENKHRNELFKLINYLIIGSKWHNF